MDTNHLGKTVAKVALSIAILASGVFAWFAGGLGPALGGGTEPTTAEEFYQKIWIIGIVGIVLIFNRRTLNRRIGYWILTTYAVMLVVGFFII